MSRAASILAAAAALSGASAFAADPMANAPPSRSETGASSAGDLPAGTHFAVTLTLALESTSAFRGYRARRLNPNPSAALDIEYAAAYAGLFAAPVAFGADTNALLYGFAGYAPSLAGVNFDFGAGYYAFPDSTQATFDVDGDGVVDHSGGKGLFEAYGGLARAFGPIELSGLVFYSPNSFGESGPGFYGRAEAEATLPEGFGLTLGYGLSRFNDDILNDDYDDWSASLSRDVLGLSLTLRYSDTVGALGPDNRTFALVVEAPFTLLSSGGRRARMEEKLRNRWIVEKDRLRPGR
jgi:uncharacterized protein (TIGR02001 family)